MPTKTSDLTPNRTPNSPIAPLTSSPNASKKRKVQEISTLQTTFDGNGDASMGTLPPSRNPAISPEAQFGGPLNTFNPMTGQQASSQDQTDMSFGDTLTEKLQSTLAAGEADNEGQSAKRPCAGGKEANIGWTDLGTDPHVLAAIRGNCRVINNKFSLTNPAIVRKNKGRQEYLVQCDEGCYVFKEDLTEGWLVTHDMDETLARLEQRVVIYEGKEPIHPSSPSGTGPASRDHDNGDMDVDG